METVAALVQYVLYGFVSFLSEAVAESLGGLQDLFQIERTVNLALYFYHVT